MSDIYHPFLDRSPRGRNSSSVEELARNRHQHQHGHVTKEQLDMRNQLIAQGRNVQTLHCIAKVEGKSQN